MSIPYTKKVIEHFKHPHNVGTIENPDGKAMEGSPACGDMVAVYINVNKETQTIEDIKFQSYGCASNIATGSIITDLAMGKTIEEAKQISWNEAADELGGLPPVKQHCSVLAVDGLKAAIQDYEEKNGISVDNKPTDIPIIEERLKHVMNPISGLDIVKTDLIKHIDLKGKTIDIIVDLPFNHQFANAIKEDILDKLQALWDIETVNVNFTE